ncbi:MAG: hypothetical protein HYY40_00045 [Bacteroidetes bacterium]|nr:hypothetical protein [Bacteroidota bacterium]
MSTLTIRITERDNTFLLPLLTKLGYAVKIEKENDIESDKSELNEMISPTLLFGKWKNIKLNPINFRKKLWQRTKKY